MRLSAHSKARFGDGKENGEGRRSRSPAACQRMAAAHLSGNQWLVLAPDG